MPRLVRWGLGRSSNGCLEKRILAVVSPVVLHVTDSVNEGGVTRAVINLSRVSAKLGGFVHRLLSLRPPSQAGLKLAGEAGVRVLTPNAVRDIYDFLESADIVQVEYCNHPLLNSLARDRLPPMRLLVWFHIAGDAPPQVITDQWIGFADLAVAVCSYSYRLRAFRKAKTTVMVHACTDRRRIADLDRATHSEFSMRYLGTLDAAKLYERFMPLNARVVRQVPRARFSVGGASRFASAIAAWHTGHDDLLLTGSRINQQPYVADIRPFLAGADVCVSAFAYPTYAAAELGIQEMMLAGLPSVVLGIGGGADLIDHEVTGFKVSSEAEYVKALELLEASPDLCRNMGSAAREAAVTLFDQERWASVMNRHYSCLLDRSKLHRKWPLNDGYSHLSDAAKMFVEGMGSDGAAFAEVVGDLPRERRDAAESHIVDLASRAIMRSPGFGSPQHYLRFFPDDRHLWFWCGLIALFSDDTSRARLCFEAAKSRGLDPQLSSRWLRRTSRTRSVFV